MTSIREGKHGRPAEAMPKAHPARHNSSRSDLMLAVSVWEWRVCVSVVCLGLLDLIAARKNMYMSLSGDSHGDLAANEPGWAAVHCQNHQGRTLLHI
jgi:hypothetical protein